jgi:predicted TIM-barrel fold metal-dependent hydrolase
MISDYPTIDVNITLGQWPTRRVPCDEPAALVAKLREHNVVEAWAGSHDGLFHDDLASVNNRLASFCRGPQAPPNSSPVPTFRPFGSINPVAPNWEVELKRCHEVHRMPGIRLHPNYHGYPLDHPNFARLLQVAADRQLIVQLVVLMEDARMMHPLLRVPPVDIGQLQQFVAKTPGLKLVLLNATSTANRTDKLFRLLEAGEVYVEIAMLEVAPCIEMLLENVPLERILFGSHTPSFYFEAAVLKLKESALPTTHLRAITHENARRLLSEAPR